MYERGSICARAIWHLVRRHGTDDDAAFVADQVCQLAALLNEKTAAAILSGEPFVWNDRQTELVNHRQAPADPLLWYAPLSSVREKAHYQAVLVTTETVVVDSDRRLITNAD